MTSRKRLVFSYCCLALLLAVLFAVSLFWGSVALTPQAVLAALTGRGQDALSVGIITWSLAGKYGISRGEIERMCPAFQGDV